MEQLHPEEKVTTLILVRHGETKQTEGGMLYTDHAAELTDKGLRQAEQLGDWLKREKAEVVLSSRARRVQSTAEIVAAALQLSIKVLSNLDEASPGDWEGRTYLDIKKENPEQYHAWCNDPIHNAPPNGESVMQQYVRVVHEIKNIVNEFHGKRIIVLTHAGVIRAALVGALGMPVENFWRISAPTGSACKIDYTSNFATVHYLGLRP